MVSDPDDLNDKHHESHQLPHPSISAIVVLSLFTHCDEVLAADRYKQGKQQQSKCASKTEDRSAPTMIESVPDGADRRARADNRRAERTEDEEEAHVAAAGEELFPFTLSSTPPKAHTYDEYHPNDEPAQKQRYILRIQHFYFLSFEWFYIRFVAFAALRGENSNTLTIFLL